MNKYYLNLFFCLSLVATIGSARAEDKIPLKITLPMPLFSANGPVPFTGHNLEPPQNKPPELLVPVGTTNLALHKPVTASSKVTLGNLSMVTDGDKGGDEGGWVELEAGKQWIQIDLQNESEIYAIQVWHFLVRLHLEGFHKNRFKRESLQYDGPRVHGAIEGALVRPLHRRHFELRLARGVLGSECADRGEDDGRR
jgi:hypothetical protein